MIQEFPKALYRGGEYLAVADAEGEASARADGYDDWADDHARAAGEHQHAEDDAAPVKRKYTRKAAE